MRAFQVTITEIRERKVSVVSHDLNGAKHAVQAMLGAGESIKKAEQVGEARAGLAREAILHLLRQDYLTLNGKAALVEDWLRATVGQDQARQRVLNARLALAGLRVTFENQIVIGSAGSVPTLGQWFEHTEWQGPDLISTLRTLPDAVVRVFSFAGINSKAVVLPSEWVLFDGDA